MPPGARQELRSSPGAPKRAHSTRTETRAVGCGRLLQGPTKRAEGRHVPHMSPFTVELILTAVHCSLIGRPRASSSPTAREMPRGVAVASIARLPSSTDDPPASGSTADRHERGGWVTEKLRPPATLSVSLADGERNTQGRTVRTSIHWDESNGKMRSNLLIQQPPKGAPPQHGVSALSSHASSSRNPTRPPESVPAGRED